MCIIVDIKGGTAISDAWLSDFYKRNRDGYGSMRYDAVSKSVVVNKGVPANEAEFIARWREEESYDRVLHLRMKTHGEINEANCHPYKVVSMRYKRKPYEMWLVHNGVLSTGNAEDKSMSDTWHYIKDYLAPIVEQYPEIILNKGFQELLASHIGYSNKFVLLDSLGNKVVLNRDEGEEFLDGDLWLSNTYAWTSLGHASLTKEDWATGAPRVFKYVPSNLRWGARASALGNNAPYWDSYGDMYGDFDSYGDMYGDFDSLSADKTAEEKAEETPCLVGKSYSYACTVCKVQCPKYEPSPSMSRVKKMDGTVRLVRWGRLGSVIPSTPQCTSITSPALLP